MNKLFSYSSLFRENLLAVIGVCLCVYFIYHAVAGNRSLMRMHSIEYQIETLSKEETELQAQRAALEKKVAMMRPGTVDKDLLEERVRAVLGYQKPHEFTVLSN
jgi:cell division protein FtsB